MALIVFHADLLYNWRVVVYEMSQRVLEIMKTGGLMSISNEVPQLGYVCRLLRILDVCKMRHCFPNILWNACLNHPTISC